MSRPGLLYGVLCILVFSGCGSSPTATPVPEYRIGVLAVLSGPRASSSGLATVRGAELATAQINESGGVTIDGIAHQLVVVVQDYLNRPDAAAAAARTLINQSRVDAIVGPQLSDHAIPVARIAEAAHVPMISPMSTNPETTANKEFVFRVAFLDDFQGEVMARFARDELSASRAAVLFDVSSTYSRDLARLFMASFEEAGGEVVASEQYTGDDVEDFAPALRKIKQYRPDVLFLPNFSWITPQQIRQAREVGLTATLLGGDTWDLDLLAKEPSSEGSYATHQWNPALPTAEAESFRTAYQDAYDDAPGATAALSFDAVMLLGRAVTQANSSRAEDVRGVLAHTPHHEGASGSIAFNGSGDPSRSAVVSRIAGGKPTIQAIIEPR